VRVSASRPQWFALSLTRNARNVYEATRQLRTYGDSRSADLADRLSTSIRKVFTISRNHTPGSNASTIRPYSLEPIQAQQMLVVKSGLPFSSSFVSSDTKDTAIEKGGLPILRNLGVRYEVVHTLCACLCRHVHLK
jgi:hypothetical protein